MDTNKTTLDLEPDDTLIMALNFHKRLYFRIAIINI